MAAPPGYATPEKRCESAVATMSQTLISRTHSSPPHLIHAEEQKILDIPDEHLDYLEETVYPTLLTALEKLLQRVEERPNDVSQPFNPTPSSSSSEGLSI